MIALVRLEYEEHSMHQKIIILMASIFIFSGCMDKTKLNNDADAGSIEEKKENQSPKGVTFKKNADGKHILYEGSFFNLGKKEADQVGLPDGSDRVATGENTEKTGLADVFSNLWPKNKKDDELNDQNFEPSQVDVSSSEIEAVPDKRKSMLEQFTTITWPWEKK
jgi:hypothetical protein